MLKDKLIVAIDKSNLAESLSLCNEIRDQVGFFKLGLEFFFAFGSEGVNKIAELKVPIFLDLKLHDIPNTVSKAVFTLLSKTQGVEMLTFHASGGGSMLKLAKEKIVDACSLGGKKIPMSFGVTVLTSLDAEDQDYGSRIQFPYAMGLLRAITRLDKLISQLSEIELNEKLPNIYSRLKLMVKSANYSLIYWTRLSKEESHRIKEANILFKTDPNVSHLNLHLECMVGTGVFYNANINVAPILNTAIHNAKIAFDAGIDGVVSSCFECKYIKNLFPSLKVITPGIRPKWYKTLDDQSRTAEPLQAIQNGADYLVIGRPITESPSPKEAIKKILDEITTP